MSVKEGLMSTGKRRLVVALAVAASAALPVFAGCGSSTAARTPGAAARSTAASPPPAVSRDPQAATHVFARLGFAIAYGGDWVAQYPNGNGWQAKDPPSGQPLSWSMLLVGYTTTRAETDRPTIVISVWTERTSADTVPSPGNVAARLSAEKPYEVFRPTMVKGYSAMMAAFRDPNATTGIQVESYLLGESGIVYGFELRAPVATWATDASAMRGILQSFFRPGG
jgi:hypothetical protein